MGGGGGGLSGHFPPPPPKKKKKKTNVFKSEKIQANLGSIGGKNWDFQGWRDSGKIGKKCVCPPPPPPPPNRYQSPMNLVTRPCLNILGKAQEGYQNTTKQQESKQQRQTSFWGLWFVTSAEEKRKDLDNLFIWYAVPFLRSSEHAGDLSHLNLPIKHSSCLWKSQLCSGEWWLYLQVQWNPIVTRTLGPSGFML